MDPQRQAGGDHTPADDGVDAESGELEAPRAIGAHEAQKHHRGVDRNSESRRDTAAQSLHLEPGDENQVEDHVENAAARDDECGRTRIAHGAQKSGAHVEDEREHHGAEIAARISHGLPHELARRPHKREDARQEDDSEHRYTSADDERERHSGVDGTREPVVVTLAEKLTGNHSTTGTKADAKTNCELRKGQRGLNATKRDLATELPDDIRVDEGIGLLEEGTEENGHT